MSNTQALSQTQYQCKKHNELITNVCQNTECIKLLCPECVKPHFQEHKKNGTQAEIETIKKVRSACIQKVQTGIQRIKDEKQRVIENFSQNPQKLMKAHFLKLDKTEEIIHQLVKQQFSNAKQKIKKKIQDHTIQQRDFNEIFDKMDKVNQEMTILQRTLEDGKNEDSIKSVCFLDLKTLLNQFEAQIGKVVNNKQGGNCTLFVDDAAIESLKVQLQRVVNITKENLVIKK